MSVSAADSSSERRRQVIDEVLGSRFCVGLDVGLEGKGGFKDVAQVPQPLTVMRRSPVFQGSGLVGHNSELSVTAIEFELVGCHLFSSSCSVAVV